MRLSVVTISFNQGKFIERAIRSVLSQTGVEIEYAIVDPGSTDDSRAIIERYRDRLARVVYEKDEGPADGLNKGFARATGDVFCYLNADDEFAPRAFERVKSYFVSHLESDVVCGHSWIVDECGKVLRRCWSDPYDRTAVAYGMAIQMQASTFIRAGAFRKTKGFNCDNCISWDGELLADLALAGARIDVIDEFLSLFRTHSASITGAALFRDRAAAQHRRQFERLMGRPWSRLDDYIAKAMFVRRQFRNPRAFFERLRRGKVLGRGAA